MPTCHPRALALAALLPAFALAASSPAHALPGIGPKQTWIDLYGGWASQLGGHVYARVHTGKPPPPDTKRENRAEKFLRSVEALELEAARGAAVKITIQGKGTFTATADDHGFIDFKLPAGLEGPLNRVAMTVVANKSFKTSSAIHPVPVWTDKPGELGVISDIDDTLTDTDVPHKLHAGFNALFHSMYDVKVFDGSGKVLSQIAAPVKGFPARPLFFVSGGPWNLHTRTAGVFALHGIPRGAFILRRYSKEPLKAYDFKHPHLQELFTMFPGTRWVMFGDVGEEDPEVYKQMSVEKPKQIEHIYIHNLAQAHSDPNTDRFAYRDAAGQPQRMTVFDDWSSLLADIAQRGYVFGHGATAAGAKKTGTE